MLLDIEPFDIVSTANKVEITMIGFTLKAKTGLCEVHLLNNYSAIRVERIEIPEEVYVNWGTDDQVIVDYVLQTLNLIEA